LKDPRYSTAVLMKVGKAIFQDVIHWSSENISCLFGRSGVNDLISFNWQRMYQEISRLAPNFMMVSSSCLNLLSRKKNSIPVILVIMSILCYFRNIRMNLFHKVISLILCAGHCSTSDYDYVL
jgi:hypothetical protein